MLDARRTTVDARRATHNPESLTNDAGRATLALRTTLDARRAAPDTRRATCARRAPDVRRRATCDARRALLARDARRLTRDTRHARSTVSTELVARHLTRASRALDARSTPNTGRATLNTQLNMRCLKRPALDARCSTHNARCKTRDDLRRSTRDA